MKLYTKHQQIIFENLAAVDGDFFLCNFQDIFEKAMAIDHIDLCLRDRYIFAIAPSSIRRERRLDLSALTAFANARSKSQQVSVSEIVNLPKYAPTSIIELEPLENDHKVILLYLWLT